MTPIIATCILMAVCSLAITALGMLAILIVDGR